MKIFRAGQIAIFLFVIIFLPIFVWLASVNFSMKDASYPVRISVLKLVIDDLVCDLTGDYREVELRRQANLIKQLSQSDRMIFYRELLIRFEWSNYLSNIFDEDVVGNDALGFVAYLKDYKMTPPFSTLSGDRRNQIEYWIGALELRVSADVQYKLKGGGSDR